MLLTSTSLTSGAPTFDGAASWTVEAAGEVSSEWLAVGAPVIPATVPGEVHVDLLAAGLIIDPFDGDNESRLGWIGRTDWTYRTSFRWSANGHTRHDLVAEGLDTVAMIALNGHPVAQTANQHRTYRFEVTELLVEGLNELVISFRAPVTEARRRAAEIGERPCGYAHPYNAIRKMASSYGWDWGPDLAGVGIWRPIRIESWSGVRLASVRSLATWDGSDGVLETHLQLEWAAGQVDDVQAAIRIAGQQQVIDLKPGQADGSVVQRVTDIEPWWPVGYGRQPLYPVEVDLRMGGELLDSWRGRVGFRTVTLSTAPDHAGSEFVIAVNGQPVYVHGANWIPDDAFLTRLNHDTYARSIGHAVEAGVNFLRVWGGGIYESEDFYALCDEHGIMVWQDFLLACAAYSEDEPLWSEFEAEAREAVTRLAQHPSLVLWNGGNENIWGFVEWDWRTELAGRSWGDGYYTKLFPSIVAELDPRTSYSPGSPFSYAKYHHPNDDRHGTVHEWEVWNRQDYRHYRDRPARFVSEFGFQGPPAWSTLTSVVHDQPLHPYGPQLLAHQKAQDGNEKLERGLGDHLPHWRTVPEVDVDDWHWLTSLNQARAVTYGIEHFRSHFPLNRGTVVWQLNDNWPVISWAAVDAHGIRKPLWYGLRRVHQARFCTIQPRPYDGGSQPVVVLHNDSPETWTGELVISRRRTVGSADALARQSVSISLEPRSATSVPIDPDVCDPDDPKAEYLVAEVSGDTSAYWYFVEDTEIVLAGPTSALDTTVAPGDDGYAVTVSASSLVKDLTLFPDRLDPDASVDSGLVTLAAGQQHTFHVRSAIGGLDRDRWLGRPVLRSVNDLVGSD